MFLPLCVCLSVSRITQKVVDREVGCLANNKTSYFDGDLDHDLSNEFSNGIFTTAEYLFYYVFTHTVQ